MQQNKFSGVIIEVLAIMAVTLILASSATASSYKVIHVFTWAKSPSGSLAFDAHGHLYGTTQGSTDGSGTVYQLTRNTAGTWSVNLLYNFRWPDGSGPSGVIRDAAGNLYGTVMSGGSQGTVFKLSPQPDGSWVESVLHHFSGTDGNLPVSLVFDAAGNLYGVTLYGGSGCGPAGCGVVFKLVRNADGSWAESVLYSFAGGADGQGPQYLTMDSAGNLYGATSGGGGVGCGGSGCGVIFKVSPDTDGTWHGTVLHSFTGGTADGGPFSQLILDGAGNLYGTAASGAGTGVVFKLTPNTDGSWTYSVLHAFAGGAGGDIPSNLVIDSTGSLYGTALGGACGVGVVFKLTPAAGSWKETVLHTFVGYGAFPDELAIDSGGNLYGTTWSGSNNYGLVFEITP